MKTELRLTGRTGMKGVILRLLPASFLAVAVSNDVAQDKLLRLN